MKRKRKHTAPAGALVLVRRADITPTRRTRHKRRKKKPMGMPPALAKWHREHKRHGRKSKKSHHHHHKKRRSVSRKHHRRRRFHSARRFARKHGPRAIGFMSQLLPTLPEAVSIGAAALYGKLEGDAAKDKNHMLRSVPAPLTVIGRSGNLGLGLWILGALTKQRLVRAAATGVVDIAAYQLTRRPEPYGKSGDEDIDFKLAGAPRLAGRRSTVRDPAPEIVDRFLNRDDDDDDDDGC